jgi:hypothetical protein
MAYNYRVAGDAEVEAGGRPERQNGRITAADVPERADDPLPLALCHPSTELRSNAYKLDHCVFYLVY